jgi:predicted Zn-dependent protease
MTSPDPRSLLYRQLDPQEAQAITAATLAKCDDGELYMQFTAAETFAFDDGRLKTADYSRDSGFGLRGVSGEMTGFAHANEISAGASIPKPRRSMRSRLPRRSSCSRRSTPPPGRAIRGWRRSPPASPPRGR